MNIKKRLILVLLLCMGITSHTQPRAERLKAVLEYIKAIPTLIRDKYTEIRLYNLYKQFMDTENNKESITYFTKKLIDIIQSSRGYIKRKLLKEAYKHNDEIINKLIDDLKKHAKKFNSLQDIDLLLNTYKYYFIDTESTHVNKSLLEKVITVLDTRNSNSSTKTFEAEYRFYSLFKDFIDTNNTQPLSYFIDKTISLIIKHKEFIKVRFLPDSISDKDEVINHLISDLNTHVRDCSRLADLKVIVNRYGKYLQVDNSPSQNREMLLYALGRRSKAKNARDFITEYAFYDLYQEFMNLEDNKQHLSYFVDKLITLINNSRTYVKDNILPDTVEHKEAVIDNIIRDLKTHVRDCSSLIDLKVLLDHYSHYLPKTETSAHNLDEILLVLGTRSNAKGDKDFLVEHALFSLYTEFMDLEHNKQPLSYFVDELIHLINNHREYAKHTILPADVANKDNVIDNIINDLQKYVRDCSSLADVAPVFERYSSYFINNNLTSSGNKIDAFLIALGTRSHAKGDKDFLSAYKAYMLLKDFLNIKDNNKSLSFFVDEAIKLIQENRDYLKRTIIKSSCNNKDEIINNFIKDLKKHVRNCRNAHYAGWILQQQHKYVKRGDSFAKPSKDDLLNVLAYRCARN